MQNGIASPEMHNILVILHFSDAVLRDAAGGRQTIRRLGGAAREGGDSRGLLRNRAMGDTPDATLFTEGGKNGPVSNDRSL